MYVPLKIRDWYRALDWGAITLIIKSAVAAALSWALARVLLPGAQPVFAPLAALLVVQVTIYQTVSLAIKRIVGVLAGVVVAMLLGRWLGVHTWTIALVSGSGLALGRLLRLGPQSVQVAVTGVLMLAVGGTDTNYASARILETMLGGIVGVVLNIVFLPPLHIQAAEQALRTAAVHNAKTLQRAGFVLGQGPLTEDVSLELLRAAREQPRLVAEAGAALGSAQESLRFNLRHRARHEPDVQRLRRNLETLERVASLTRSVSRALYELAADGHQWDEKTRAVVSACLMFAGFALTRFGDLIAGDVTAEPRLREALGSGRSQLAVATEVLLADGQLYPEHWDYDGAMLADLRRMFFELEADSRPVAQQNPL